MKEVNLMNILGIQEEKIEKITIVAGYNKLGEKENFSSFSIKAGEIVAIVGPTGSGKSRLLADIEWGAQGDTPTKRNILVNGKPMDSKKQIGKSTRLNSSHANISYAVFC